MARCSVSAGAPVALESRIAARYAARSFAVSCALGLQLMVSQAMAEPIPRVHVVLQGDGRGCLSSHAISDRIEHYFTAPGSSARGFRIVVRARPDGQTEFELQRDGSPVSVRHFPTLPDDCDDRLNAVSIALAMAIEQAASSPAKLAGSEPRGSSQLAADAESDAAEPGRGEAELEAPDTVNAAKAASRAGVASVRLENVLPDRGEAARAARPIADTRDAAPSAPESESTGGRSESFSVHAGGGVVVGLLPSLVGAGVAGAELPILGGKMRLRISGMMTTWSQAQFVTGQVETQILAARAGTCLREQFGWIAMNACGGLAIGRYSARGSEYLVNRQTNLLWNAGFSHLGLRVFDRGPLMLEAGIDIFVNMIRPSLRVEGAIDDPLRMPLFASAATLELLIVL